MKAKGQMNEMKEKQFKLENVLYNPHLLFLLSCHTAVSRQAAISGSTEAAAYTWVDRYQLSILHNSANILSGATWDLVEYNPPL